MDLLLLASVRSRPGHGYGIIEELRRKSRGAFDLPEGSVYPALHRLEKDGLVTSRWTTVGGRRRREYKLSEHGRAALGEQTKAFRGFVSAVSRVLEA